MRFSVHTRPLPWAARLALLFGGRIIAGAVTNDGRLVVTVGIGNGRGSIWWQEWTGLATETLFDVSRVRADLTGFSEKTGGTQGTPWRESSR